MARAAITKPYHGAVVCRCSVADLKMVVGENISEVHIDRQQFHNRTVNMF